MDSISWFQEMLDKLLGPPDGVTEKGELYMEIPDHTDDEGNEFLGNILIVPEEEK